MDFDFTPRQKEIYDLVGRLGRENFAPRAARHDREASLPLENLQDLRDNGLLKLTIGRVHGGWGSGAKGEDPLLYLLAVEQTARYCPGTAQCLHIHSHGAHYVDQFGSPAQKDEILGRIVAEGVLVNGTGSEPGRSARGLYGLLTFADQIDGGYVLNGVKNYATLAGAVAYNIVYAQLRNVAGPGGHVGFAIPRGTQGLGIVEGSWQPMGMRAAVSPELRLDDCFVDQKYLLGPPGTNPAHRWQAKTHLGFAAQYIGAAQGIFDALQDYLPRRGTSRDSFTQLHMGEILVGIESARWLVYRSAWLWTRGDEPAAELYAMVAKHRAGENAVLVMDKAAQIAGSSAFLKPDSVLSRLVRDLRFQTLHEHLDRTASTIGQAHLGEPFDTTARL